MRLKKDKSKAKPISDWTKEDVYSLQKEERINLYRSADKYLNEYSKVVKGKDLRLAENIELIENLAPKDMRDFFTMLQFAELLDDECSYLDIYPNGREWNI